MKKATTSTLGGLALAVLSACGAAPEGGQDFQDGTEVETGSVEQEATLAYSTLTTSKTVSLGTQSPTYTRYDPTKGGIPDPKDRPQFSPFEDHLSALGSSTLDCLGTASPDAYTTKNGILEPTFDSCPLDKSRYESIKNLLGIQYVDEKARSLFMDTWKRFQETFDAPACPIFKKVAVINPPNEKTLGRLGPTEVGKENYAYAVHLDKYDPKDVVTFALECTSGFGSQFHVSADYEKQTITVDPVYWMIDKTYTDGTNPFTNTPGYYHRMSFYGASPGAVYGAVERAGERCSQLIGATHYTNRTLKAIDCDPYGGGWYCASLCTL